MKHLLIILTSLTLATPTLASPTGGGNTANAPAQPLTATLDAEEYQEIINTYCQVVLNPTGTEYVEVCYEGAAERIARDVAARAYW